jgi:nucleoside-diphosphate-sugar epimerase
VEDLAEAHVLVIQNRTAENQIFNLEGMRKVTIREIAETIKKLLDGKVKIVYTPARSGDYAGKEVSNEKVKNTLGWEPKIDFEEGMRRTIEWYCKKHNLKYSTPS